MICLYDIEVPTSAAALAATVQALPHRSIILPDMVPGYALTTAGERHEPIVRLGGLGATEAEAVADWWLNFVGYAQERGETIFWRRRPEIERQTDFASAASRWVVMARLAIAMAAA